jgi:hypothetical protein
MKVPGTLDATLANLNNTINKAFVYGWLLDKKVKVSVGKGTDEAWGLFYSNYATTTGFDGKDGVKVDVLPIEGLSLGVHYGTDDLFAKAVNDGGFNDQGSMYRRFVAGVKYTADSFGVVASTVHNFVEYSYELKDDKGKDIFIKEDWNEYVDKPLPNTSNVLFGLWVAPIEPLRIDLSVAAVNLGSKTKKAVENDKDMSNEYKKGDYNPYWFVLPKLKAEYTVNEQLGIGLEIGDILFADTYYTDVRDTDPEKSGMGGLIPIKIAPSATYAINDDVTAGLELGFNINSGGSDQFGIGVKPSAEFSLGSGATFVVWDELTFWLKSNDSADFIEKHTGIYKAGGNGGASGTTNSLQFDFVWTF